MHCLVTPKLLFSVPRDASWRVAGDVPQHILREGFSRRFPLTIAGLDHLSFEAVGKRELGAAAGGADPPAVYRLTSSDEAEERILLGILRALERAYESKHRLALDQARTDMLSSSMTFQVMADEIRARQEESKAKFDKETAKLKDNLTTTSKRLFLLEHEKDSLTKAFHSSTETTQLLQNTVEKLHRENLEMRDRMAKLESRLAEVCDGRGFADVAPAGAEVREQFSTRCRLSQPPCPGRACRRTYGFGSFTVASWRRVCLCFVLTGVRCFMLPYLLCVCVCVW